MDIQNFIAEFKKTFVYDMLKDYVTDEKLFDHFVTENGDIVFLKEQTRQMWSMCQAAKTQAVPEGFVLVPKELTHEQAVKISDHPEFFEIYQNIVLDSDTSEDSVSVLLRIAHKAMIETQEQGYE